jgi:hypothetical protein
MKILVKFLCVILAIIIFPIACVMTFLRGSHIGAKLSARGYTAKQTKEYLDRYGFKDPDKVLGKEV